jgi:hypothetical protein
MGGKSLPVSLPHRSAPALLGGRSDGSAKDAKANDPTSIPLNKIASDDPVIVALPQSQSSIFRAGGATVREIAS